MERTTDDGRRTDRRWQASHIPSLRRRSKNKFDFETEKLEHQRQVLNHHPRAAVHRNAAIFEIDRNFDHILLAYEFQDDISNSSRVIVLTNTHTHTHTPIRTNDTLWGKSVRPSWSLWGTYTQTNITENNITSLRQRCACGNKEIAIIFIPRLYDAWLNYEGFSLVIYIHKIMQEMKSNVINLSIH